MEQICFELENIELSYLDKKVLDIDRLAIHQFDRIGIVGRNGAGKSTLLKIIGGIINPSRGKVNQYVEYGYFEQLEGPIAKATNPRLLGKLQVKENASNLSGGEQTRLKLAQLFTHFYDALLIDEPTTHLDQDGISFLIEELKNYYGALILISHDRAFLDELVTTIWEIDEGTVKIYSGNYSDYMRQKQIERTQQVYNHEQFLKEKNRLEKASLEKMKKAEKIAKSTSMSKKESKAKPNRMFESKSKGTSQKSLQRAAKAIEQRINQLQVVEAPNDDYVIHFHSTNNISKLHNKFPIMGDCITLEIDDKVLLKETSFQFPLGKTIAITGKNGSGKTTLIRHIIENGEGITISPKAEIGIYEQMGYQFDEDKTVLSYIKDRSDYDESKIRSVLNAMSFTGNDLKKKVQNLSGGESIRLVLCQLFLGRYNILVLDEPTNFLDIFCIEALESILKEYKGTVIIISHDKKFVEHVSDIVYRIENQKLKLVN
ncbi:ABC-F type ribosomal protection protein Msr(H) [Macrococcoides canis]|uniref:ABC-F type ribosomal protection protein Msr(H) n=1 Tax=Macrococcoides canis TaxID=1855823 RepID=UPI0010FC32B1|nr:ABC-F type ribosomal protection protein Msr(H) [Macrococcus canis]QCT73986.1 ABC-F type ribosomal protection protein [Macrococcus canis]DAC81085.1 TPA_inf: ABC-F type ribosomal protection protein Msr(H) [Macrococcus canis]